MDIIEALLSLANITYLLGTVLLAEKVLRNRESIKDYDFHGSLLTMLGMIFSIAAQIELGYWIVTILMLPTLIFWILVSALSHRMRT